MLLSSEHSMSVICFNKSYTCARSKTASLTPYTLYVHCPVPALSICWGHLFFWESPWATQSTSHWSWSKPHSHPCFYWHTNSQTSKLSARSCGQSFTTHSITNSSRLFHTNLLSSVNYLCIEFLDNDLCLLQRLILGLSLTLQLKHIIFKSFLSQIKAATIQILNPDHPTLSRGSCLQFPGSFSPPWVASTWMVLSTEANFYETFSLWI